MQHSLTTAPLCNPVQPSISRSYSLQKNRALLGRKIELEALYPRTSKAQNKRTKAGIKKELIRESLKPLLTQ